jgi:hypothetical protein
MTAALAGLAVPPLIAELHDLSTMPPRDPPRVTLFLYDIVEEPTTRNRAPSTVEMGGLLRTRRQPLSLCLHYMITAWGGSRETEQRMLGRVMQRMYEDAVVDGVELTGSLTGSSAQLRVSLAPMRIDDRARVWWAIGQPYRLSVNYEVRVVDLDVTTTTATAPVTERVLAGGLAPLSPGVVP